MKQFLLSFQLKLQRTKKKSNMILQCIHEWENYWYLNSRISRECACCGKKQIRSNGWWPWQWFGYWTNIV